MKNQETLTEIVNRTGSYTAAARELGCHRSTIARRLLREQYLGESHGLEVKKLKEQVDAQGNIVGQSVELGGESTEASAESLNDALDGITPEGFYLKSAKVHISSEGEMRQAWPAFARKLPTPQELRESFAKELKEIKVPSTFPKLARRDLVPDLLSAILVGDPHFGQLSWAQEVGDNYNLTIAKQLHIDSLNRLLSKSTLGEKGLLAFMGDNQHNDDPSNRTPASGHNLDVDGRPRKIQSVLSASVVRMIEVSLRYLKEVWVVILPGNHDGYSAGWLYEVVSSWFRNEPRVKVIGDARHLVAVEWGNVMLGMTHGHETPLNRMAEVMSADYPEMWGRTKIRVGYQGHVHSKKIEEKAGLWAETVNTLTAPDKYAHTHPFRSRRSIELKNFHKVEGWHSTFIESIIREKDIKSWKIG